MNYHRLLTALPARPVVPGPPAMPSTAVLEQCLDELDERQRAAAQAVVALGDPALAVEDQRGPARHREHFAAAHEAAVQAGSRLLQQWLEFDEGLREALAARRAAASGRPWIAAAPDVAHTAASLAPLVASIDTAGDPRARQLRLDTARLRELERSVGPNPFGADAVHARIVAALIEDRWDLDDEGDALEEVWG